MYIYISCLSVTWSFPSTWRRKQYDSGGESTWDFRLPRKPNRWGWLVHWNRCLAQNWGATMGVMHVEVQSLDANVKIQEEFNKRVYDNPWHVISWWNYLEDNWSLNPGPILKQFLSWNDLRKDTVSPYCMGWKMIGSNEIASKQPLTCRWSLNLESQRRHCFGPLCQVVRPPVFMKP